MPVAGEKIARRIRALLLISDYNRGLFDGIALEKTVIYGGVEFDHFVPGPETRSIDGREPCSASDSRSSSARVKRRGDTGQIGPLLRFPCTATPGLPPVSAEIRVLQAPADLARRLQ